MTDFPDDLRHVVRQVVSQSGLTSPLFRQVFSWDPNGDRSGASRQFFDIPTLASIAKASGRPPEHKALIVKDYAKLHFQVPDVQIDIPYARSITPARLTEPGIIITVQDPTDQTWGHVLCDGNHRVYRAWELNHRYYPVFILNAEETKQGQLSREMVDQHMIEVDKAGQIKAPSERLTAIHAPPRDCSGMSEDEILEVLGRRQTRRP